MKRVLMVAYHFPPLAGSSGIQRTLRFVQQLPELGWQPLVLTVHPCAYERTSHDLQDEVPSQTIVRRAFALDAARHLSVRGRYLGATARPDRWASWKIDGVRQGMRLVREFRPDAIWSTYPIATSHMIAAELRKRSGVPWIADFRDPMAQPDYPSDVPTRQRLHVIEQWIVVSAEASIFTAPNAVHACRLRHPDVADRVHLIENGYDEESFAAAATGNDASSAPPLKPGAITLLHSGIVYPCERDPTQLFEALGQLKRSGAIQPGRFTLRFRAPVHDELLTRLARDNDVLALVEILPAVPYREALQEMLRADALLVMQGQSCNDQIPAKIYEYLRAGRPAICLSHPDGDTIGVMHKAGMYAQARLDSVQEIATRLPTFLDAVRRGTAQQPDSAYVSGASRRSRTQALAGLLDRLHA